MTDNTEAYRKRRRKIIREDDEEEEESLGDAGSSGNVVSFGDSQATATQRSSRAVAIDKLVRERRKKRQLSQEIADLHIEEFTAVDQDDQDDDDQDQDDEQNQDDDIDAYVGGDDDDDLNEEDMEGEDLMDNMQKDYQKIAALDHYGKEGMDDRDYDAMDIEERQAAEAELARRDRELGKGGRQQGLYDMAMGVMDDEDDEARRRRRGVFRVEDDGGDGDDGDDSGDETDEEDLDGEDQINLEAFDVPLREWIAQDRTRREIQRRFRAFLRHFTEESLRDQTRRRRGNGMYEQKIRVMCASNYSSLKVSYLHLMESEPVLAAWTMDAPKDMLDVLNEAVTRHTLMLFPSYTAIKSEVFVRMTDIPIMDSLRDLRRSHLDRLVKVSGVVTRRSTVNPQLQLACYRCLSCKLIQGPFRVNGYHHNASRAYTPDECPECEGKLFKLDAEKSVYRNVQRVNLQETPGSVPPGRVPRTKEVVLTDDLIDLARPGEEIEVTGVFEQVYDYSLTIKSSFPVFSTYLAANHVLKREDVLSTSNLSQSDIEKIVELSKDPKIGERIVKSIAPSIYGQETCKMALAMSLFGAVPKNVDDKHRIRGDINVLFLGDAGTAKSQMLKYAERVAPRAVYSAGKGASAVGLTAGVHKDPITKEWTLEGGALVLADRGVALIDEFDKMNEQDRTSIHEAMEQQSISVSKAGIVTSLQARCAVIAAANPIGGQYDSSNTLADNVELTDPILQRFDILCVLQDQVDPVADERLALFVTSSHMNSVPTSDITNGTAKFAAKPVIDDPDMIDQALLRKYIQYARTNVRPSLRNDAFDREKVASLYVELRAKSQTAGGVPVAVRHIESMMRMAEAHAKMHLRDYVREDDVDASIRMMLESFVVAQKFSVRRSLRRQFAKYLTSHEDRAHLLLHMLQEMFRMEQMYQILKLRQRNLSDDLLETLEVPLDEMASRARERRIYDVTDFCRGAPFREAGYVLDQERGVIMRKAGLQ